MGIFKASGANTATTSSGKRGAGGAPGAGASGRDIGSVVSDPRDTPLVKLPQVPDKMRSGSTPTDRER
jgi:hypothetical protein